MSLSQLSTDVNDISENLERGFVLRNFNRNALRMDYPEAGSKMQSVIGIGYRYDKDTGKNEPVDSFYPSYYTRVLEAFRLYPIAKIYGLSPDKAMALPVSQWRQIIKEVQLLPPQDDGRETTELLKQFIQLFSTQTPSV